MADRELFGPLHVIDVGCGARWPAEAVIYEHARRQVIEPLDP